MESKEIDFETRAIQTDMSLYKREEIPYPPIVSINEYLIYKNKKTILSFGS
jgi:hypothetical protein